MFVEAEVWTVARTDKGNAVLVRPIGSELAVPIFIGQLEAQSILIGLGSVPMPRPLTHDLFLSIMEKLKVEVEKVEITELKGGTFYARLQLLENGRPMVIDSRPSDALGIAVRIGCPVFISDEVVEEAGISVNLITEEETQEKPKQKKPQSQKEMEKEKLSKELEKAVEEENYEEAARIRDRLKEL